MAPSLPWLLLHYGCFFSIATYYYASLPEPGVYTGKSKLELVGRYNSNTTDTWYYIFPKSQRFYGSCNAAQNFNSSYDTVISDTEHKDDVEQNTVTVKVDNNQELNTTTSYN